MWLQNLIRKTGKLFTRKAMGTRVVYALPDPTVYRKFFNQDRFFDEVDWSDWNATIEGFEQRFVKWYFAHMSGGHASYVDLCALSALIDIFSLHLSQTSWHASRTYKEFLRKLDPLFRKHLPAAIRTSHYVGGLWKDVLLRDIADVFYAGVRCSLLHHGDLAAYAGMSGTGQLAQVLSDAGRSLCGTDTYALVVFDPAVLRQLLRDWLARYCGELRRDPGSGLALAFRARMRNDFGIVVP